MPFLLTSPYQPAGDQPQTIKKLLSGLKNQQEHQVLLGVTGSGKTFTMANIIASVNRPTLIISHNKTLAAQLYQEFRDFFPKNAINYFVSYYDYYQPEAYLPSSDTYIEKETDINDEIDKLRLSATANLLTRPDVVVVASVSCIYNLGSPLEYSQNLLELITGQLIDKKTLLTRLTDLQYERNDYEIKRGVVNVKGENLIVYAADSDKKINLNFLNNQIESITINGQAQKRITIFPAKHYLTNPVTQKQAISQIETDMKKRLAVLGKNGQVVEAYRLEQKVSHDLDMIRSLGYVNGIENYSRYFDGREPGDAPFTLLDYFKFNSQKFKTEGFLTIIDESHMTVPQIRAMFQGDQSRKKTLIDFGFRLPSALDNRPLKFSEFLHRLNQTIYTSATPNPWEISLSGGKVVEQLVRPTGLIDPQVIIRPSNGQIKDLIFEIQKRVKSGQRTLVTTLTKKTSEALTEHLQSKKIKVQYLHSGVDTLDRSDILADLRQGRYDVVVGINLLREGLDLPEVSLVAILDADKAGFLRSQQALIQTMGRASRHLNGLVIMYADTVSLAMAAAINEVKRRRKIQLLFNKKHHLAPQSIKKPFRAELVKREKAADKSSDFLAINPDSLTPADKLNYKKQLQKQMKLAIKTMAFELAAKIRDKIIFLEV